MGFRGEGRMKYVYPAVFTPEENKYLVGVPDLKGCYTFGDTMIEALEKAREAAETWLWDAENKHEAIPVSSDLNAIKQNCEGAGAIVSYIIADTSEYRRQHDNRAVNKMVTLPAWLKFQAEQANAPFSQILQQGLKEYLHVA